jgi:nucleotide-binding universal stress UspA family protein
MGEILVAYDGSSLSKKALDKAVSLLKENDELIVLHVIPSPTLKEFAVIEPDVSITKAQEIVNSAISDLKAIGVNVVGIVREGDIADEILKIGNELECDLIVVGSTGKTTEKIGRFLLGSVADKVAKYSNRPVLIVR